MNDTVLDPNLVWTDIQAKDKADALTQMSKRLQRHDVVADAQAFLADVMERETMGATGIGGGIAIPHGKSDAVKKDRIAIGVLHDPIEWETLDDLPVKIILLFAVNTQKDDACNTHLGMMASVAGALAHDTVVERLGQASCPSDVLAILHPYMN